MAAVEARRRDLAVGTQLPALGGNGVEFSPLPPTTKKRSGRTKSGQRNGRRKTPKSVNPLSAVPPQDPGAPPSAYRNSDRHNLCLEMLQEGFAMSFVDFFKLTSEAPQEAVEAEANEKGRASKLDFIKQHLCEAEAAQRQGDMKTVFSAYRRMADYYEDRDEFEVAISFHQRCLEIGHRTNDTEAEGFANSRLGLAYERMGDVPAAISFYERYHRLSTQPDRMKEACEHLVRCYQIMAERCERKGDFDAAIEYFRQCLEKAAVCGNLQAEGETNYKLGEAFDQLEDAEKAVIYFTHYLDICRRAGDKVGEGKACYALANQYQKLGDLPAAIDQLETYIAIADATGQQKALCDAACSLGIIFNKQGEYSKAVRYFQQNFEQALELGDASAIDNARVQVGVSLGQARMNDFMALVNSNSDDLLAWKDRRKPVLER